ncbi:hypothetical protein FI667_g1594, partial [Globisporangium splendens]
MPVRQFNLLKRVRSTSPSPALRSPAATETTDQFALKVSKHQLNASPRSSALQQQQQRAVSIMTSSQRQSLQPLNVQEPQAVFWPRVTSCDGVRNAITFLQTSRQHAMMLMLQNHWERAVGVLEKIEKATESVCSQRRKVVLKQVNAVKNNASVIAPVRRSAVRFSDHVHVAAAVDMDRACDELDAPVREEMLVLRASRTIPKENYSEFW